MSDVTLHEGRPFVSATGAIELWHPSCWAIKDARGVEEVTVIAPEPRGGKRWLAAGAAAVVACVVGAAHATATSRHGSVAVVDLETHEAVALKANGTTREALPTLDQTFPIPEVDGQRLDDLYPSLVDWIHPVTGAAELYPAQPSRHFGAERKGVIPFGLAEQPEVGTNEVRGRPECGAGHCGVDLDGPRGRPVVAVADGTVVRVEHHEFGLDGRSGRYVRIEHDDGTLTAYMHLDDIAEGLEVGDHVDGGQMIGTLGATAVYASAEHLHFSLEIPNHPGQHGDNTDTHYIDPAPFLMRAKVVSVPDRRHGLKPAM